MTIELVIVLFIGFGLLKAEAADYFPLEVGNRWIYSPSYGSEGDRIDTIIGKEEVNETITYVWNRQEAPDDNYNEKRWLAKDDTFLRCYKLWGNEGGMDSPVTPITPWIIPLNPVVGDTWEFEIGNKAIYYKSTSYVESATESVTVAAGTFHNCIIVREFGERTEGGVTKHKYKKIWYAPGVGPIIYRSYHENWNGFYFSQELLSFTNINSSLTGYLVTSDLWIRAVINTVEKGPVDAIWQKGGEDTTSRGDRVIWGHFYASPNDVTWGSQNNPDLFVKIWFDVSGRVDVNYFHVSVPDIEVYSDYPYDGTADEQGTTTMDRRYIRQYYENGQSHSEENYEDGNPPAGYLPTGNPFGYSIINDLRIGTLINTVEKGPIDAVWRSGGQDTTSRGDQVVWGHFYASPSDVTWGSENNPDLFVKIWFDVSGRVDVNFFHVSVPDIEVYSDLPSDGTYDQKGTTIMDNRYIRHEYCR
jgi:hypothetical protein